MSHIALATAFNFLGLAIVAWGVSMMLGAYSPFAPEAVTVMTGVGLGMVLISAMLLVGLKLFHWDRQDRTGGLDGDPAPSLNPVPLRHQDQLVNVMQDLRDSALELIERRREVHHLNTHQWHHAHRDEIAQEISANKRYRQSKTTLELHRLSLPTEFWGPVDDFCDAIDESISRETYSSPKDRQVYDNFDRVWHSSMRQINDTVSGRTPSEEVRQLAD